MIKSKWIQISFIYSIFILAFAIPLPYIYGSAAAILMGVIWLLQVNFKHSLKNLLQRKALWTWLVFFILHVFGYFYSTNKADASWDLGSKLCFFLLPIILGCSDNITEKSLESLLLFFIAGVTFTGIYCIGHATIIYMHTKATGQFFYNNLIEGLDANAVAESWYTIFALIILFFNKWKYHFANRSFIKMALILFNVLFLILLASKTLLIFLFVILMPIYIYQIYWNQKIPLFATCFTICCFLAAFLLVFYTQNPIKKRFSDVIDNNPKFGWQYSTIDSAGTSHFNNLTLRLFLWRVGYDNVKANNLWWYGAGIGDVHKLQNKRMSDYGIKDIYNTNQPSALHNINLHNMYLETLIMLGIPGLICLLIIFFQPLLNTNGLQSKLVFALFFVVSILFMMQESALQSQDGRIFYCFFNVVFWSLYYTRKREQQGQPLL